jgi:hypothetical protein
MKKITFSLLLSLALSTTTMGSAPTTSPDVLPCDEKTSVVEKSTREIDGLKIAQKYIDYLKAVGASPDGGFMNSPHPFAAKCKKIINGKLALETDQEFKNQLKDLTKASEGWQIEPLDQIAGNDGKTCVVRYFLTSKTLGQFTTIAILHYDSTGALEEVNEVYHPVV